MTVYPSHRVTITGRREALLRAAADEMEVDWIAGDVGIEADAARTVAEVIAKHGRLDILACKHLQNFILLILRYRPYFFPLIMIFL